MGIGEGKGLGKGRNTSGIDVHVDVKASYWIVLTFVVLLHSYFK